MTHACPACQLHTDHVLSPTVGTQKGEISTHARTHALSRAVRQSCHGKGRKKKSHNPNSYLSIPPSPNPPTPYLLILRLLFLNGSTPPDPPPCKALNPASPPNSKLTLGPRPRKGTSQSWMRFWSSGSLSSPMNVQFSSISLPSSRSLAALARASCVATRALTRLLAYSKSRYRAWIALETPSSCREKGR